MTDVREIDLPWCGCGEPERVAQAMLAYLTPTDDNLLTVGDSFERYLLAVLADRMGWTEHGTTIRYSWLTEEGEAALPAIRAEADR